MLRAWQRRRLIAGVELGDAQLRLAVISAARTGDVRLERYALASLPPGAVIAGQVREPNVVGGCLRQLVTQLGVRGTPTVIGMKTGAVHSLRLVVAPAPGARELEAAVRAEVQGVLPYALDEVYLDYADTGDNSEPARAELLGLSATPREVVIAACKRDTLHASVAAVAAAGLRPQVAEPEGLALGRLLCGEGGEVTAQSPTLVVLLDAGLSSLHVFIGSLHTLCYEWRGGSTAADTIAATIAQEASRLTLQLPSGQRQLDRALLVGVVEGLPELAQRLEPLLRCPVERGNPFAAMPISKAVNLRALAHDAATLAVACGLAQSPFGR